MKILENQLFEGKSWHGYTGKEHLINAFAHDPVAIAEKLEQVVQVNLKDDFVTSIMNHGTYYIDSNKDVMQWFLKNYADNNYELLGAYADKAMTIPVASNGGPGSNGEYCQNGSSIFMVFENKPFSNTQIITGLHPEVYSFYVKDEPEPIGGNRWLYEIQSVPANVTAVPYTELLSSSRWSSEGGLIPDDRSHTGFDLTFSTNGMLESRLTRFRMKHVLSSRTKDIKPLYFFVTDDKGKPVKLWLTNVELEFYRQARYATAAIIMFGKATVKSDGTTLVIDKNGETITAGSGFKEQWSATNKHLWAVKPELNRLTEIAMSVSVGRTSMSDRKYVIKAGEWGLMELSKMVQRELGSSAWTGFEYLKDTTGRAYKWGGLNGNEIDLKLGQFMGVATINGIQFMFMVDPSKDEKGRNKLMHPLGGPVSSYEYDIFLKDQFANMQIVRRKGETPKFYVEEGPLGFFNNAGNSFKNPQQISSAVEGAVIHYIEPGVGSVCWDPTKVVRYYPTLTYNQ